MPQAQVSPEQSQSSPQPTGKTPAGFHNRLSEPHLDADPAPESILKLSAADPDSADEYLHHIIIGSPLAVERAIRMLHVLRYVEQHRWTPQIPVREEGLRITPHEGQVLSYLLCSSPKRSGPGVN